MNTALDEIIEVRAAAARVLESFPEYKLMKEFFDEVGVDIFVAGAAAGMRLESDPDDFQREVEVFRSFQRVMRGEREKHLRAETATLVNLDTGTTLRVP